MFDIDSLKQFTAARIAQGRTGTSLPTKELLKFGQAHAAARDAVLAEADFSELRAGLTCAGKTVLDVASRAKNRSEYLQRPDMGRMLSQGSKAALVVHKGNFDVQVVVADGLSAYSTENARGVLGLLLPELSSRGFSIAPVVLAKQARVAIGDSIALALGSRLVLVLIGERPGLSSPDSLGAYITFNPKVLTRDSARNCVSNIRPEGLDTRLAAWRITHLISEALRLEVSGIELKDSSGEIPSGFGAALYTSK